MKVFDFPLIKITLFFVLGIVLYPYIPVEFSYAILVLLLLLSPVLLSLFKKINTALTAVCLLLSALVLGLATCALHDVNNDSNHYIHSKKLNQVTNIIVEIDQKIRTTALATRYEATVVNIDNKPYSGRVIIALNTTKNLPLFETGTQLKITSKIQPISHPKNPGQQFDYKKYLENKSIFGQIYVSQNTILYKTPTEFSIKNFASKIRNKIITNLEKNNFSKEELYVFSALLLGQQQDISKEIIADYQYAGAVHILSVSGLHVGLLLTFITFILSPLANTKTNRLLKLLSILLTLSFFGVLAGLAPSVLRSVTMFSFVAIGLYLNRSVNFYNTLLVSAFVLLLFKPSFLYDVGFQLSYFALFFIVWAQPLLSKIWSPNNKITHYFWDIVTVSTAAQIGTLPISIYYFHQFSGLFFITNCIILPFLSVIMGVGILVLIMALTTYFWQPVLKLMELLISFLNYVIHYIASLDELIFKEIPLTFWMMLGLYIIIFTWIIYLKKPNFAKLSLALISIIIFQLTQIINKIEVEKSSEFIVFSNKKSSLFVERNGKQITLNTNSDEQKNVPLTNYTISKFAEIKSQKKIQNFYLYNGKKIVVIDRSGIYLPNSNPDILIVIQSPKVNLDQLLLQCKPKQIIADESNYKSYVSLWAATCKKQNIPFHAVAEKGYFKIE